MDKIPADYSLMPFWFWNDTLHDAEIVRQIADFQSHGIDGFVIHPRVGLPRSIGWMSDAMLRFMRVAIDEARRRGMKVILYDEGMYPSGSSCGQVVASDPTLACRCLALQPIDAALPTGAHVVATIDRPGGDRFNIIDRPSDSFIRGLHYTDEATAAEDEPLAGDILNPRTTQRVIELIHDRFAEQFGKDFGTTIVGVFTDEPSPLGRPRLKSIRPFTTGILPELKRLTGEDFSPKLAALFFDDEPDAAGIRERYAEAIRLRLNETWYAPLSEWCERHGIALMGHPDAGDEIGVQRFFHVPGQDLVWRWVEPGNANAIEGRESTQGKCSSSAMLHAGRSRNSNEFCGAYGAQTTFDEVKWLAHWAIVRGVNWLIPHAFYYSIRGPRKDERPPQLGPHTPEWDDGTFKAFADECRYLCWLNATSRQVCDVAILTHGDRCPWRAAKVCFEHQIDFNYLDPSALESARVDASGVTIGAMRYAAVVVDGDAPLDERALEAISPLIAAGRVLRFGAAADSDALVSQLRRFVAPTVRTDEAVPTLRVRKLERPEGEYVLLFNEGVEAIDVGIDAYDGRPAEWVDAATGTRSPASRPIRLRSRKFDFRILRVPSRN